ncbi:MAG: hypothetical protein OXP37_01675 [Chloroflexota bacterium]|nr:hypothetical protein [Chloroflexota bacterium]
MADPSCADRTIFTGDNLPIMWGMNSDSVDLIYLDPPFNSRADYAAPIGSKAAGAAFKDTWSLSDIDAELINLFEDRHSSLWRVIMAAMTPKRQVLFGVHGGTIARNAAVAKANRKHLLAQ